MTISRLRHSQQGARAPRSQDTRFRSLLSIVGWHSMRPTIERPWAAAAFDFLVIEASHARSGQQLANCRLIDFTIMLIGSI
jgi:hypothetical protein